MGDQHIIQTLTNQQTSLKFDENSQFKKLERSPKTERRARRKQELKYQETEQDKFKVWLFEGENKTNIFAKLIKKKFKNQKQELRSKNEKRELQVARRLFRSLQNNIYSFILINQKFN